MESQAAVAALQAEINSLRSEMKLQAEIDALRVEIATWRNARRQDQRVAEQSQMEYVNPFHQHNLNASYRNQWGNQYYQDGYNNCSYSPRATPNYASYNNYPNCSYATPSYAYQPQPVNYEVITEPKEPTFEDMFALYMKSCEEAKESMDQIGYHLNETRESMEFQREVSEPQESQSLTMEKNQYLPTQFPSIEDDTSVGQYDATPLWGEPGSDDLEKSSEDIEKMEIEVEEEEEQLDSESDEDDFFTITIIGMPNITAIGFVDEWVDKKAPSPLFVYPSESHVQESIVSHSLYFSHSLCDYTNLEFILDVSLANIMQKILGPEIEIKKRGLTHAQAAGEPIRDGIQRLFFGKNGERPQFAWMIAWPMR